MTYLFVIVAHNSEIEKCTSRFPDPISLHGLHLIGPCQSIEVTQQRL